MAASLLGFSANFNCSVGVAWSSFVPEQPKSTFFPIFSKVLLRMSAMQLPFSSISGSGDDKQIVTEMEIRSFDSIQPYLRGLFRTGPGGRRRARRRRK